MKAQTPKIKRKMEFKNNAYHVGQILSVKNGVDGLWYTAKITDFDVEEKRYIVEFSHSQRRQIVKEENCRPFLVGSQVCALYKGQEKKGGKIFHLICFLR